MPHAYHGSLTLQKITMPFALLTTVFTGAIFGFFYAWICSAMWGLDAADPRVAIAAMQAANASVRNFVFAPAFFGTPLVAALAAALTWRRYRAASVALALAGAVYALGALLPTLMLNVPMNEALGATPVPDDIDAARAIWAGYSPRWQVYNIARTLASGLALLLAADSL